MKKYYLIEFSDDDRGEYFYCLQNNSLLEAEYTENMLEAYGEMQTMVMDALLSEEGATVQLVKCTVTGTRETRMTAYRVEKRL